MAFHPLRQIAAATTNARPRPLRAESVLVIGLGRFGASLAQTLVELGTEVLAIDIDEDLVNEWAPVLRNVRVADGTNPTTLQQLDAADYDVAVVAIGTAMEASILATAALAEVGVEPIWAKANRDDHGRILERVGAHHVVYPEREMGERIAHAVSSKVIDYIELDKNYIVVEMRSPPWLVGKELAGTNIRERGVSVVCLQRPGEGFSHASAHTVINSDDVLVVAGEVQDIQDFAKSGS